MVRKHLLPALALLAAVAPGVALAASAAPRPAATAEVHAFAATDQDYHRAARVLRRGFGAIHDKQIQARPVSAIALAGLDGLSTIDTGLRFERTDDATRAIIGDKVVLAAPLPKGESVKQWSGMVTLVARELRRHSPALSAADIEAVTEAIFDGALEGLDRHTRYDPPDAAEKQRSSRNGFSGIGVRYVREDGNVRILELLPKGPADGVLRVGDLVTHADGHPVAGMETAELKGHLRGPRHSKVVLTVQRGEGPAQDLTLVRDTVVPQTVRTEVRDAVAVVRIERFNATTATAVRDAVTAADAAGPLLGAVLDLRANPGGLLDQAYAVADLFLDTGVLVTTRGRHPGSMQSYEASAGDLLGGRPMVVLIDGRSASSAEILAAALKDNGRATAVGTNSYGKGTVQTIVRLPNRGELKLTWSRFHGPAGYAIQGLGVLPSLCLSGHEPAGEGVIPVAAGAAATTKAVEVPAAVEEAWLTVPLEETAERQRLRDTCVREVRKDVDADVEVALDLIHSAPPTIDHAALTR